MNYIDFAIAVAIFLFFFAMVLTLSTNYFSNISGSTGTSEFMSIAEGFFKLVFGSEGLPENWETNSTNPVQLGLIGDMYRIPILVKETYGYDRTNEPVYFNLTLDINCENKAWNNSIRVFDVDGNEIPFKFSDEVFCSSQFLKRSGITWETNISKNQNRKFYFYYSSDDSINPPNYTDTVSTVAYWHFDEGSGNYIYDSSWNENNGTLYNNTNTCSGSDCPNWVDGKFGKAIKFDGSDDYVRVPNSASLNVTQFTVTAWIYANSFLSTSTIVGEAIGGYTAGFYWLMYAPSGTLRAIISNSTAEVWSPSTTITTGKWYFLTMVVNSTHISLYLNNSLVGNSVLTFTPKPFNNFPLMIGAYTTTPGTSAWNGTIDEVRIWNRALSAEEINTTYNSGPIVIKSFPEEHIDIVSQRKLNALMNISYEQAIQTLGDYKFRIEISEG